jgi:predicted PurR-regulated permease PerM
MNAKTESPVYQKISLNLITIALLALALYLGADILLPLFFAVLLAVLLHPVVVFLTTRKLDRVVAILLSIFLSLLLIGTLLYFLSTQIGNFLDDIPTLKARLKDLIQSGKEWVQVNFNIGIREQNKYLSETTEKMTDQTVGIVQQTVVTLTGILSYVIFLPVYTFLILYHKAMIKHFLTEVFKRSEQDKIVEVLDESQAICQQYLMGMLIELVIVFTLNSAGFLIIGVKYPIFLALVAALLNIIPYIGMLIANIFCVIIALISSDPSINVLWVFAVLGAVQIIDNNILMPWVVGSRVKINALAIIVGVVVAGSLCGIAGMFLAIPGLALVKVVFERVETLRPWAILLSDETTEKRIYKNPLKRVFDREKKHTMKTKESTP